jgi:hypothetical protein
MDFASTLSMLISIEWIVIPVVKIFSNNRADDYNENHLNPLAYKIMKSLSSAVRTTRY